MGIAKRLLLIALIVLAVLVLLAESVPRLVSIPGLTLKELDPYAAGMRDAWVQPHPYLAYAPKPGFRQEDRQHRREHNSLGFRGPEIAPRKPAGTLRIACLGGSSTYGFGPSSNETTWPMRLEHHLRQALPAQAIEVINGGCQGYSTFESLGNLAFRMLDLSPDVVIVYHTVNDMHCALYPGVKPDNTHWRAVWLRSERSWIEDSRTFLILRRYLTDYILTQKDLGNYAIVDFDANLTGGRDPYAWRADTGFRNFHRNLNSIVSLALDNGAAVVLATQGLKRETWQQQASRDVKYRAFDAMTETVRVVARERGATLVEAARVLEAEAERRKREGVAQEIFTNDVHLTDAGADLLARTFAQAILQAGLLSR